MKIVHWLYERLTARRVPRFPDEWRKPSRFRKASIWIVAVMLFLAALAHTFVPDWLARSDVPNAEPWPLCTFLFWGAVAWAAFSLVVFGMNRKWRDALLCLAWYGALAALTLGYFLIVK